MIAMATLWDKHITLTCILLFILFKLNYTFDAWIWNIINSLKAD